MTLAWAVWLAIGSVALVSIVLIIRFLLRTLSGAPWYLLIGPEGAGKTTLVAGAQETVVKRDIAWHYFDQGVVIDVAGRVAFPPGGSELTEWRRLLRAVTWYRPRRPLDGVILAVPASTLLDEHWQARTQDLGAAIRERFVTTQRHIGLALPVYVVVTQADQVRGFSAFAAALPDHVRQNMLGWSNPHAPDQAFAGTWIDEGIKLLQRSIVLAQVELFGSKPGVGDASDASLFSDELRRLSAPLMTLLEEVFRPSRYHDTLFFRGFYLCGQAAAPDPSAVSDPHAGSRFVALHPSPERQVSFVGDLLDQKVFPEQGLATPLPDISVARHRVAVAGQVACGLLVVGLLAGSSGATRAFGRCRPNTSTCSRRAARW